MKRLIIILAMLVLSACASTGPQTPQAPALSAAEQAQLDAAEAKYKHGDYAAAFKELRPFAEEGNASAQAMLGYLYSTGQGVAKDPPEAAKWYRKAADQGDAKAQFHLGVSYAVGDGAPEDEAEAVKWFRKAADQGLAEAQEALQKIEQHQVTQ